MPPLSPHSLKNLILFTSLASPRFPSIPWITFPNRTILPPALTSFLKRPYHFYLPGPQAESPATQTDGVAPSSSLVMHQHTDHSYSLLLSFFAALLVTFSLTHSLLQKKCVNLNNKILRQKCVNHEMKVRLRSSVKFFR